MNYTSFTFDVKSQFVHWNGSNFVKGLLKSQKYAIKQNQILTFLVKNVQVRKYICATFASAFTSLLLISVNVNVQVFN